MKIICPLCKNQTTWEENPWRPFCSERCKMIDLGKWAQQDYRISGTADDSSTRQSDQETS